MAGPRLAAALFALGAAVSSGWIADGLKGECLFEGIAFVGPCTGASAVPGLGRVLFAALVFAVSVFYLYRLAKRLLPVRHLSASGNVRQHRVLMAALSPLRCELIERDGGPWVRGRDRDGRTYEIPLDGDIQRDIDAFTQAGWPWPGQQFLRALRPHITAGRLTDLVLLGSPGDGGSARWRPQAAELARLYVPGLNIECQDAPVGFEALEDLQGRFDHWIEHFRAAGVPESQIILDVTGGLKTTSIAAALTTLRWNRIEFQYVQTAAPFDVLSFNLTVDGGGTEPPF
jgi:hypothetical protein